MSVDLYEHYKEALRRGHMAVAHGELDAALEAYREAVNLAPDRALPRVSIGQILLRQGDAATALQAFDAALLRTPHDESGLRGRGEALARLGRRTDAAAALDLLSDIQERAGRLADASDSTRRALDLAEQKARRRRLHDLTRRVRLAAGDVPADRAPAESLPPFATAAPSDAETVVAAPDEFEVASIEVPGPAARAQPEADGVATADALPAGAAAAEAPAGEAAIAAAAATDEEPPAAEPEPSGQVVVEPRPIAPDPVALTAEAETLQDAGDLAGARDRFLAAAMAFEGAGLLASAIDACYVALAFAPDDAEVHLRLVELYLAAGWKTLAADKLALLGRLTELDNRHGSARARIVGLAADHFPDDPRLTHLTAAGG